MDTIPTTLILDRGAQYLGNHPDALAKRIALAQLLVDARVVRNVAVGINLFRLWAVPEAIHHDLGTLIEIATARTNT